MIVSLGTSGTIYLSSKHYLHDPKGAIHDFMGADGGYALLSCSLSSASCLKWLYETLYQTKDYEAEEKRISPDSLGHNHVYFLPYLMGERSPINDPAARGLFIGMDLTTSRAETSLAVMEGVAFALRDSLDAMANLSPLPPLAQLTGGGSKIALWRQLLANVLGLDLSLSEENDSAAYGMALLCLEHAGIPLNQETGKTPLIIHPDPNLKAAYQSRYETFKKSILPSNRFIRFSINETRRQSRKSLLRRGCPADRAGSLLCPYLG